MIALFASRWETLRYRGYWAANLEGILVEQQIAMKHEGTSHQRPQRVVHHIRRRGTGGKARHASWHQITMSVAI